MCLHTSQAKLKVAESDITCYKAIRISMSDYVSWYRGEPIPERVVNGLEPYEAEGAAFPVTREDACYPVVWQGGLVHTFASLRSCEGFANSTTLVYRCTIPKGSEYAEGVATEPYGGVAKSYASRSLVFNERVYDGRYDTFSQPPLWV